MELSCTIHKKNIGKSKCNLMPNVPKMMITTPDDFYLEEADYASDSALLTALQALLVAGESARGYLWPQFSAFENRSEEQQYEDTVLGMLPMRDGQYRFLFGVHKNMCTHKAMFTHRAVNEGRVFIIDMDNQIWGTIDDDGNIRGFSIQLLHTEKFMLGDGSSNSTKSPVFIALADNEEFDKDGVLLETRVINRLERLTDVTLTIVGSPLATAFVVDVKQSCDGIGVSGLLLADFIVYASDGVTPQTILSVVEDANVEGRYTVTAPTVGPNVFEDGFVTLRAAASLTVQAYEAEEVIVLNV